MPKMKTKKAASKRFNVTKTGKVKFKRANKRHCASSKTTKQKRRLRKAGYINKGQEHLVKDCLPYAA